MYFTSVTRYSPEHGRTLPYYKIKESFRDVLGRVHTRVMLTPGYLPDLCCDEIVQIRRGLTYLMEQSALIPGQPTLFPIDSVFNDSRQLKTDLELRPMNHQSNVNQDPATKLHPRQRYRTLSFASTHKSKSAGTFGSCRFDKERKTRLELATPTLARLCSTN